MGEKMTLEQVRDKLREEENAAAPLCYRHEYGAMADAIDAHLTQPAQAVDVERWSTDAIYEARGRLELTGDEIWISAAALPNANGKEDTDAAR